MKSYYIVVSLTEWTGGELRPANIAGRYNSIDELQADKERAVQDWITSHDVPKPAPGEVAPIYIYDCIATI